MERYYIAYGSNLNKEQMEMRCPGAIPMGTAFLEGYRLAFKGSKTGAYLTVEQQAGSKVPVAVWAITAEHERALDRYEGYPNFYYKKEFKKKIGKKEITCFLYIMNEEREYGLPSDFYIMTCAQGYDDFDLDEKYLQEAINFTEKEILKHGKQ